ncbi:MAG TPA: toll/interleukin-1 receptor domain-containing protein, partial [Candidatus Angelobacter sp.]
LNWLERGLPLRLLKIVAYSARDAKIAKEIFLACQKQYNDRSQHAGRAFSTTRSAEVTAKEYECFLSYSHKDSVPAQLIVDEILRSRPNTSVFFDHSSIDVGSSWLMEIGKALDNSKRVVALYTPDYWSSLPCVDEFMAARTREYATGKQILFPIYFRKADLPTLFLNLQFFDCREGDQSKLADACGSLIRSIRP